MDRREQAMPTWPAVIPTPLMGPSSGLSNVGNSKPVVALAGGVGKH